MLEIKTHIRLSNVKTSHQTKLTSDEDREKLSSYDGSDDIIKNDYIIRS